MGFLAARCDRAAGVYRWTCAKPTGLGAWVSGKSEGLRETDRFGGVGVGKVRGLRETDRDGAWVSGKSEGCAKPTGTGAWLSEKSDLRHQSDRFGGVAVGKVRGGGEYDGSRTHVKNPSEGK